MTIVSKIYYLLSYVLSYKKRALTSPNLNLIFSMPRLNSDSNTRISVRSVFERIMGSYKQRSDIRNVK